MFIGVAFHFAHRGWLKFESVALLASLLFLAFMLLWSAGPFSQNVVVAWNYGFALALFLFAYRFPGLFSSNRLTDFFASISYPLYVLHGVAGYVALRILVGSGLRASVSLSIVTASALCLAWLVHRLVERPSQALIDRIKARRKVGRREPSGALAGAAGIGDLGKVSGLG